MPSDNPIGYGSTKNFGPIEQETHNTWSRILRDWRRGYAADETLAQLEQYLEAERQRIFEALPTQMEAVEARDWSRANVIHSTNIDHVRNYKKYYDDLRLYWIQWEDRASNHFANISLEAFRSMIIINGAAIIASLAVLSGQISNPSIGAIVVAKVTTFTSVLSLLMLGLGHSILWLRGTALAGKIRGSLVGHVAHSRINALWRYVRRYGRGISNLANALIFGSIGVFGLSAAVSAIFLAVL